jgi:hypothetical protein
MRFAMFTAVLMILPVSSRAQDSSAERTASCARATSSLERHDLGCPDDDDVLQALPDDDPSD